jgi:hypothetical protein
VITQADFVAAFPEFANAADYPPAQFGFWQPIAYAQLNAVRLGASLDLAAMLFIAHNIALSKADQKAALNGAPPGGSSGPLASKSVGPVSASYDTGAAAVEGDASWNLTSYGQRLRTMLRGFSLGPAYRAPRRTPFTRGFFPFR